MNPRDATFATAEHLRTIADRLEHGTIGGVFMVWLDGDRAKWSHFTPPREVFAMIGATQSCQLALVQRLAASEAKSVGDVADG
jgi:hypothetical protein